MLQKLQNLAAFSSARDALRAGKSPLLLDGLAAVHKAHFAAALCRDFPGTNAVMLGRGLMRDPALLRRLRGGPAASAQELRTYHDRLLEAYRHRLSGDQPVMHRMWELWAYLSAGFTRPEPYLKRMRKAKNLSEYRAAVDALFREQRYTT